MGARTDDAHVSQENVKELRDLIQTGVAKEPADAGDPGITGGSAPAIGVIIDIHGPEFIAPEVPAEKSHTFLFEENRAFGIEPDEHHENGHQPWENGENDDQREDNIDYPFQHQIVIIIGAILSNKFPVPFLPIFRTTNGSVDDCTLHVTKDWFSDSMRSYSPDFDTVTKSKNGAIGIYRARI